VFLASEVMLFGALFSCYALLASPHPWPSGRDVLQVPLSALNTLLLVSLTTIVWRARSAQAVPAAAMLAATALALAFLVVKGLERAFWRGSDAVAQHLP
jgi:heme/copper-type cytochrome/quinol oxidase subunit 3